MLLAQSLQRLMLRDLHTCAHVAVTVHEEGKSTRQVFTAWKKEILGYLERSVHQALPSQIKKTSVQSFPLYIKTPMRLCTIHTALVLFMLNTKQKII